MNDIRDFIKDRAELALDMLEIEVQHEIERQTKELKDLLRESLKRKHSCSVLFGQPWVDRAEKLVGMS